MNISDLPLAEYDPSPAVIEPAAYIQPHNGMPKHCVLCMHGSIWQKLPNRPGIEFMFNLKSTLGKHPVYRVNINGKSIAVAHPGLGAPLAVGFTEEIIAKGASKIIVTGTCGVLDVTIQRGTPILVTSSLRDEGTSFHYQPASRFIQADPLATECIRSELTAAELPYREVWSWTTDALYRETCTRIQRRQEEGCKVVEMETSALFALGLFRKVSIGALLWAADDVTGASWNTRHNHESLVTPERLFDLALAACLRM